MVQAQRECVDFWKSSLFISVDVYIGTIKENKQMNQCVLFQEILDTEYGNTKPNLNANVYTNIIFYLCANQDILITELMPSMQQVKLTHPSLVSSST